MRRLFVVVAITALAGACSQRETGKNAAGSAQPAGFVDKVWTVVESPGGPGGMYVFLSDGTFVKAAKESVPDVGKWSWDGKRLAIIESALPYEAEIDSLTASYLRLTIHFMNREYVLGLAPAIASMPDTTRTVAFDPSNASIIATGDNPTWLFTVDNDRATLRMSRTTLNFTQGEWVQDCASVWDYTVHDEGGEEIMFQISTATCLHNDGGAESPLHAVLVLDGKTLHGCAVAGKLRNSN